MKPFATRPKTRRLRALTAATLAALLGAAGCGENPNGGEVPAGKSIADTRALVENPFALTIKPAPVKKASRRMSDADPRTR